MGRNSFEDSDLGRGGLGFGGSGVTAVLGWVLRILLALTPLGAAAGFVLWQARDPSEIATAALAVAGAMSLASLVQVALLVRDGRRTSASQEDVRLQTLALARCMRTLNRRMADLEEGFAGARPTAPLEATTRMAPPAVAANDAMMDERHEPATQMPAMPAPMMSAPAIEEIPLVSLPQRRLRGTEIRPAAQRRGVSARGDAEALACLDHAAGRIAHGAVPGPVLYLAPDRLAALPGTVKRLAAMAGADRDFRARFLLGLPQKWVRSGSPEEAQIMARLARAGLAFALVDIVDFRFDAEALAACNITHVRIDAGTLLAATEDEVTAGLTGAATLSGRLRTAGVALMASGVDDERMIRELNDVGIDLAQGMALGASPEKALSTMPWRAAPVPFGRPPRRDVEDYPLLRAAR